MFTPRRLALPAVALALGLSLAGCSASGFSSAGSGGSVAVNPGTAADSKGSEGSSGTASDVIKRQVVTTGTVTLESDIASRQGDLESLTAQQRYLKDPVSMSTIKLQLIALSAAIVKPGPPSPGSAFAAGLAGFGVFFNWVFLVLVCLLPWLVLAAAIWVGIVYFVRWRRRRRAAPPTV